jgi:hypothetical protein
VEEVVTEAGIDRTWGAAGSAVSSERWSRAALEKGAEGVRLPASKLHGRLWRRAARLDSGPGRPESCRRCGVGAAGRLPAAVLWGKSGASGGRGREWLGL